MENESSLKQEEDKASISSQEDTVQESKIEKDLTKPKLDSNNKMSMDKDLEKEKKLAKDTKITKENKDGAKLEGHKEKDVSESEEIHPPVHRLSTGYRCKNGWFELRASGKLPEKRSHHSSVIHNGCLYIYGGEDSREGKYGNLWKLDLEEFMSIGEQPQDDLTEEEMKNMSREEDNPEDKKLCWHLIDTTGPSPGPISHHNAVIKGDSMYLFGGMKSDGE